MSDIFAFIKNEYEKVKELEKQRNIPVYKLVDGENKLVIDVSGTREWRKITTRFGERVVIPVYTVDQKEHVLMVSPNSRLYSQLVKTVAEYVLNHKDVILVPVVITRYKSGIKYTYEVKILDSEQKTESEASSVGKSSGGKKKR